LLPKPTPPGRSFLCSLMMGLTGRLISGELPSYQHRAPAASRKIGARPTGLTPSGGSHATMPRSFRAARPALSAPMPPSPHRHSSPGNLITHVSLIGFATALSTRSVDPIIPPIAQALQTEPARVALLTTAFTLPFVLAQPIMGPVADAIGKLRTMLMCLV